MESTLKFFFDTRLATGKCWASNGEPFTKEVEWIPNKYTLVYQDSTGCSAGCSFVDVFTSEEPSEPKFIVILTEEYCNSINTEIMECDTYKNLFKITSDATSWDPNISYELMEDISHFEGDTRYKTADELAIKAQRLRDKYSLPEDKIFQDQDKVYIKIYDCDDCDVKVIDAIVKYCNSKIENSK